MGAWIVWDEEAEKYISVDICKPVVGPKDVSIEAIRKAVRSLK